MQSNPQDGNETGKQAEAVMEAPDFLVRSRQEMVRLLNAIMEAGAPLSISFMNSESAAESTLIDVDEPGDRLMLECPPDWRGLIQRHEGAESIMLTCVLDGAKIHFQTGVGDVVKVDDARVVRLKLPEFMWRFQRRREARQKAQGLKISLNLGFTDADAEVADLGLGGVGVLNCDSALQLQEGELLSACSITLPGVGQIAVDLKVQHVTVARLPDGRDVTRVGCQFTQLDDSARQLIAHCVEALAKS